jgi:hypothetical protein
VPFRKMAFDQLPVSLRTNLTVQETESAWYSVRVSGAEAQKQVALSGAFYFADKPFQLPSPINADVHASIVDAASGRPLPGTLTEVRFEGTIPRDHRRYSFTAGGAKLSVPGTSRLRAEAKGYAPATLSPVLDCPEIIQTVTGLADTDLVDWKTFERLKNQLRHVELVFRLQASEAPTPRR